MDRQSIIDVLRQREAELHALGVRRLGLFGSYARGDADEHSDIDLLSALDETKELSLLDLVHIENLLADALGRAVDLVDAKSLDPRVRDEVHDTVIYAF
ncbi:MAG: nucleotidyltransferase family protein [Alphaproteobacteria bacterium]